MYKNIVRMKIFGKTAGKVVLSGYSHYIYQGPQRTSGNYCTRAEWHYKLAGR